LDYTEKEPPKKTRKRELVSKEVPKPKKLKAKENILQAAKAEVSTLGNVIEDSDHIGRDHYHAFCKPHLS